MLLGNGKCQIFFFLCPQNPKERAQLMSANSSKEFLSELTLTESFKLACLPKTLEKLFKNSVTKFNNAFQ
jgi:hypothetical protein